MITNGYAKIDELKHRLYPDGVNSTVDDAVFESVIEALSRWIDEETARFFYKTASQTRHFTAEWTDYLLIPNLVTLTTLKTDEDGDRVYETVWTSSDYDLEPYDASLDGKPYTAIRVSPNGNYSFPTTRKGVEIAAEWGWPSTPKMAKEACLLLAERLYMRKDAPFGVIGSAELGQLQVIARTDPDAKMLLAKLSLLTVGGV